MGFLILVGGEATSLHKYRDLPDRTRILPFGRFHRPIAHAPSSLPGQFRPTLAAVQLLQADKGSSGVDTVTTSWLSSFSAPGAQPNDQAYGMAVEPTTGATYIVGASYQAGSSFDIIVIKYAPEGDTLWTRRFGNTFKTDDYGVAVALDPAGNLFVTGITSVLDGTYDIITLKFSPDGEQLWGKTYDGTGHGDDTPAGLAADQFGNVYVAGSSTGTGSTFDMVLLKYSASGELSWSQRYNSGNSVDDIPVGIHATGGAISVGGNSTDQNGNVRMFAIQYNPGGTQRWFREYNAPLSSVDEATSVAADDSGNVYLAGRTYDAHNEYNFLTVALSSSGILRWSDQYDGPAGTDDEAYNICCDPAGNIIVTGGSAGSDASLDFATIKYSPSGTRRWVSRFATPADDIAYSVVTDRLGNVYVCGAAEGPGGSYDFVAVKYSTTGARLWAHTADGKANSYDYPTSLALDRDGNVFISGNTNTGITMISAMKLRQSPLLRVSNTAIQFGNAFVGGQPQSHPVTIANEGSVAVDLEVSEALMPDFFASQLSFTIQPMDSLVLSFTFSPLGPGSRTDFMEISGVAVNTPIDINVAGSGSGTGASAKRIDTHLSAGWQLVSQPVQLISPEPESGLFAYQGGYISKPSKTPGPGYWKRVPDTIIHTTGYVIPTETVQVFRRWNLIGSLSSPIPVTAVHSLPTGIISGSIYGFASGTYVAADSIRPGHAYWVNVTQDGTVYIGP